MCSLAFTSHRSPGLIQPAEFFLFPVSHDHSFPSLSFYHQPEALFCSSVLPSVPFSITYPAVCLLSNRVFLFPVFRFYSVLSSFFTNQALFSCLSSSLLALPTSITYHPADSLPYVRLTVLSSFLSPAAACLPPASLPLYPSCQLFSYCSLTTSTHSPPGILCLYFSLLSYYRFPSAMVLAPLLNPSRPLIATDWTCRKRTSHIHQHITASNTSRSWYYVCCSHSPLPGPH